MASKEDNKVDSAINAGLAGVSGEVVSRYGEAIKEHLVGLNGVDNENQIQLTRGLNKIASYNRCDPTDPNYDRITKAQAGFSAEVKEVSRRRAEEIISGKKPTTVRTDDIPGHVNDQLFDITSEVDLHGNPVPGSSAQIKFVGSSPSTAVDRMLSKGYQKYIDNNVKMIAPSDYYDGMKAELSNRVQSLQKQIEYLRTNGSPEAVATKEAELQKCQILDKNLQKSNTSTAEALQARNNPNWSATKDIVGLAHRAGVEQAKMGAALGGGISLIRNFVYVCKGEKTAEEAAFCIAGDTTSAAAGSYITAFSGAIVKGSMQNSKNTLMRGISKTNLPAYIAVSTIEVGKTINRFSTGKIDEYQLVEELGEKGYGMVNSALFAAMGQAVIPIPIVGALAGSMLGYALSSASYHVLLDSLKTAKLAREERTKIECECAEAVAMLREYRSDLEKNINKYLLDKQDFFNTTFDMIKTSLNIGDIDGYICATNRITEEMGKKPLYSNMEEFDALMSSETTIKI